MSETPAELAAATRVRIAETGRIWVRASPETTEGVWFTDGPSWGQVATSELAHQGTVVVERVAARAAGSQGDK